ncbi:MAG: hypothetical protein K0S07_690 [Chlamydiales bacterium]|jgi:hypothetical protein|nr:hypothetical protein [Chlamydiales bacterium]
MTPIHSLESFSIAMHTSSLGQSQVPLSLADQTQDKLQNEAAEGLYALVECALNQGELEEPAHPIDLEMDLQMNLQIDEASILAASAKKETIDLKESEESSYYTEFETKYPIIGCALVGQTALMFNNKVWVDTGREIKHRACSLYDVRTGQLTSNATVDGPLGCRAAAAGKLALAIPYQYIQISDIEAKKALFRIPLNERDIEPLAMTFSEDYFVMSLLYGGFQVWNTKSQTLLHTFEGSLSAKMVGVGRMLFSVVRQLSKDKPTYIEQFDLSTGKIMASLELGIKADFLVRSKNQLFAVQKKPGGVQRIDIGKKEIPEGLIIKKGKISSFACDRLGRAFAGVGDQLFSWKVNGKSRLISIPSPVQPDHLECSGDLLLVAASDGQVAVCNITHPFFLNLP